MGTEAISDDETAPVDTDPDTEAVSHADRRVWRVVGERFCEPIV
jgi:hypothetical protein